MSKLLNNWGISMGSNKNLENSNNMTNINGHVVVFVLFSLQFLIILDSIMISPLMIGVMNDFNINNTKYIGWLIVGYGIASGATALISGPLYDNFGKKKTLILGASIFILSQLCCALSPNYKCLFLSRGLTGVGAGITLVCIVPYVLDFFTYKYKKIGLMIGIITSAIYLCCVFGIPLSTYVSDKYSWRYGFGIVSLSTLVVLILAIFYLKEIKTSTDASTRKINSIINDFKILVSRKRILFFSINWFFLLGTNSVVMIFFSQWLSKQYGYSITEIGHVFVISGLVSFLNSIFFGYLGDKVDKRKSVIMLYIINTLAFFFYGYSPSIIFIDVMMLTIIMASSSARFSLLYSIGGEMVEAERRGSFFALQHIFAQFGVGLGPFIVGYLLSYYNFLETNNGYREVLLGSGLLLILSLFLFAISTNKNLFNEESSDNKFAVEQ